MAPRILVADDDAWILRMVTTVLKKRGYEVDTALDGAQAYERALENPPDLLITDVMMPNLDGWTLVRRMREHPKLSTIPVIFLTALSSDDDRIHGFRLGADDYLPKPFRFEELDLRVARSLRRYQVPEDAGGASAPPPGADASMKAAQEGSHRASTGGEAAQASSLGGADEGGATSNNNAALAGNLGEIGLPMLLTMLEMEAKSGVLVVHHEREGTAEMYLRDGRIVHATMDFSPTNQGGAEADDEFSDELSWGLEDAECVYYLLKWTEGHFELKPQPVTMENQIGASTTQLLMEGARRLDELNEATRRMDGQRDDQDDIELDPSAALKSR